MIRIAYFLHKIRSFHIILMRLKILKKKKKLNNKLLKDLAKNGKITYFLIVSFRLW